MGDLTSSLLVRKLSRKSLHFLPLNPSQPAVLSQAFLLFFPVGTRKERSTYTREDGSFPSASLPARASCTTPGWNPSPCRDLQIRMLRASPKPQQRIAWTQPLCWDPCTDRIVLFTPAAKSPVHTGSLQDQKLWIWNILSRLWNKPSGTATLCSVCRVRHRPPR